MIRFERFGSLEINIETAPTNKRDFVKLFKGQVPDVRKAFDEIKRKKRRKTSK